MTENTHSLFGSPSSLHRHEKCPGNVSYCKDLPDKPPSEYAQEGTHFHEIMERLTCDALDGFDVRVPGDCDETVVLSTLEKVKELWKSFKEKHEAAQWFIELKVKLNADIFGTADLVFTGMNRVTHRTDVVVIDYKYGKGVVVEAQENLQGIAYLLAAIKTLKIKKFELGRAIVIIGQVRLENGWSQYEVEEFDVWGKKLTKIVSKVKRLYSNSNKIEKHLKAGDHCRFCKGNGHCVAQKKACHDDLQTTAQELPIQEFVRHLTLDQQVEIFLKKTYIEDFLEAVANNLRSALETGVTHPSVKLIRTGGRRSWKQFDEDKLIDVVNTLKEWGAEDPVKISLAGITEIEKQIGKGRLDEFTQLSDGKIQLVSSSDKRDAVMFSQIHELPL